MGRPKALDLFCGAGGVSVGLERAGFEVAGVDIYPHPDYPLDGFVLGDALEQSLDGFDLVWASPPCQAHTNMSNRWRGKGTKADTHVDLISAVRRKLESWGGLWVIENVVGARGAMRHTVTLSGGMFGLGVHRPRLFEASFLFLAPTAPSPKEVIGVYGNHADGRRLWTRKDGTVMRCAASLEEGRKAMGIDWMSWEDLKEAIPPAYAEFIGRQAMQYIRARAGLGS